MICCVIIDFQVDMDDVGGGIREILDFCSELLIVDALIVILFVLLGLYSVIVGDRHQKLAILFIFAQSRDALFV